MSSDQEILQDVDESDDPSSGSTATTVVLNVPEEQQCAETPEDLERKRLEKQARKEERDRRKSQKKGKNGSAERKKSRAAQKAVAQKAAEWAAEDGHSSSFSSLTSSGSKLNAPSSFGPNTPHPLAGTGEHPLARRSTEMSANGRPPRTQPGILAPVDKPGNRRATHHLGKGAAAAGSSVSPNPQSGNGQGLRHDSMSSIGSSGDLLLSAQNWDPNAPSETSGRAITTRTVNKDKGARKQSMIGKFMAAVFRKVGGAPTGESESARMRRLSIEKFKNAHKQKRDSKVHALPRMP